MGRRERTSVSVSPGCHGNSCLTVESPTCSQKLCSGRYLTFFGCGGGGGGDDDDDNVHRVLSMYLLLDRMYSTVPFSVGLLLHLLTLYCHNREK